MSWRSLLKEEMTQLEEEGRDTDRARGLLKWARLKSESDARRVWGRLRRLPLRDGFAYREPSDLTAIAREWGRVPVEFGRPRVRELSDRIAGAWFGRAAGCMLGKPVEGWMAPRIKACLERAGQWPLCDYFSARAFSGLPGADGRRRCLKGGITAAVRDDDMDYTVLALRIVERYGRGFSSRDVAAMWLEKLPFSLTYTAERAAYRNLVNQVPPPESASVVNPYREWIGAQIRADFWGYLNPGKPFRAAEQAFRDACVSHTKNGIYGEMWAAAAVAAALAGAGVREVMRSGLAVIPEHSRLAEAVRNTIWWCQTGRKWEETLSLIRRNYGHYHRVHTINNACVVVMAVLLGEGDFGKTIALAVMGGWDTDCNGATAGSIAGAMIGRKGLPRKWIAPLSDRLECGLAGEGTLSISGLARRTLNLALERKL